MKHQSLPTFSEQAPSTRAPHIGEGGVPQFERDPSWPKIPSAWSNGCAVSAAAVDKDDHIWLITRPRQLMRPDTPIARTSIPPAVIEFDNAGNLVRGWGGESGPGYLWPSNEHGITVDSKGFVWILGNADRMLPQIMPQIILNNPDTGGIFPNDSQVLKFTKEGKFVMAIGEPDVIGSNKTEVLRGATNPWYFAKTNELFVSDGYGNSRVVVYDADTGKLKRMWGAYGRQPLDIEDRPVRSPPKVDPWLAVSEVLQQFQLALHDVKVSDDELVYVADRGNKRVQVFTLDGKFVAEQFVGLDSRYPLQARSLAFSPDQRFLYLSGTPVVYILNRKTLEVLGTVDTDMGGKEHPAGHNIAADRQGNLYVLQVATGGKYAGSHGTFGAYRWKLTGYSPTK
jgi:hypothetical protein